MKSSTLHRSGLSKENMSMIENIKPRSFDDSIDINQYIKAQKKPELDVLWRDFEKSVQPKIRTKAPIVYAGIGFVLGLLFALGIALIIGLTLYSDIKNPDFNSEVKAKSANAAVPVVQSKSKDDEKGASDNLLEEKYTVKSGDTLDKIVFRFYGQYNPEKIEKIKAINGIKNERSIQIGQELTIPLN